LFLNNLWCAFPPRATSSVRHPGAPPNIAEVVTALAGDGFAYVTGQTLHVNGGFLMAG